jgi:hypothetical protein
VTSFVSTGIFFPDGISIHSIDAPQRLHRAT